jgi:hypothetical protein
MIQIFFALFLFPGSNVIGMRYFVFFTVSLVNEQRIKMLVVGITFTRNQLM